MEKRMLTPRILWGALLFSTFIYLAIAVSGVVPKKGPPPPQMFLVLLVVSVVVAALAVAMPRYNYQQAVKNIRVNDNIPGPGPVVRTAETILVAALPKYQTPFILGMALSESIALNGFMLGYLGAELRQYIGFFVVSWLLMLTKFPTLGSVFGPIEDAHNMRITY